MQLAMREQVCAIKQRRFGRFSLVKYALAGFRYLVTSIVALLLALLLVLMIVELGAAIDAAINNGSVTDASPQAEAVFLEGGR